MNSNVNLEKSAPHFQSRFLPYQSGELHLAHWPSSADQNLAQVLMLHGAIENGKIFYSQSGKGFGPYLAQQGFDVWIADLHGRGQSLPLIQKGTRHGQTESICSEIPTMLDHLIAQDPDRPQVWVAHSWGGVLLMSVLARNPKYLKNLKGIVFFGTKRRVRVQNPQKWLRVDFFWKNLSRLIANYSGFLPAQQLGVGSDNETQRSLRQSIAWVKPQSAWVDPEDGFNYAAALQGRALPPMLFLAGPNDPCLGHPRDVQAFMHEFPSHHADYWLLAKQNAFAHDYGHIDMLTHTDAPQDHFPKISEWLQRQTRP